MTNRLMPDFTDALEDRLRTAAEPVAQPRSITRRRLHRLLAPAMLAAGVAVALLLLIAADSDRTPPAYGSPPVLDLTPVAAPDVLAELNRGITVRFAFGPDGPLDTVRSVDAFGSTAYIATGPKGWCLTAPDPGMPETGSSLRRSAVTCEETSDVLRYGIVLAIGGNVIAALPDNAQPPTLRAGPDGKQTEIAVESGLALVPDAPPGSAVTLYGRDGDERRLSVP